MKDLINKTNSSKDSTSELFIDGSISKASQDIANVYTMTILLKLAQDYK